jgi:hypothetical protein
MMVKKLRKEAMTLMRSVEELQEFMAQQFSEVFGKYKNNCNSRKVRPTAT